MKWQTRSWPNEPDFPWLHCSVTENKGFSIDFQDGLHWATFADGGDDKPLGKYKTERGAKGACKRHAERMAKAWIKAAGE